MEALLILLFAIGYLAIAFEHPLKTDKTVPALIMAVLIWALLSVGFMQGWFHVIDSSGNVFDFLQGGDNAMEGFEGTLLHHLGTTAEILIFLIGAMSIVEMIDLHHGFDIIKAAVHTKSKRKLLWIVGILGFFLSAVIDNLTATIVLVTIIGKLIPSRKERIWYASLIVLAANSGGAWSPIGDVTTTMLWIGKKLTAPGLIEYVVIPSIVSFVIPFVIASYLPIFRGDIETTGEQKDAESYRSSKIMLFLGIGMIVSVPIVKALTELPPYMGMMLALGVVWLVSEKIKPKENMTPELKAQFSVRNALSKIDMSSILFFFGILMAVAGLEALVYGVVDGEQVGTLRYAAEQLHFAIPNDDVVILLLGILSAVVDNVPLVAATMGMYDMPIDSVIWHFIAYSAGTGGSMLIIGSAAGVAAMGMERIDFIWYLKKISWLAFVGFISGAGTFLFIERVLFHNV